MKRFLPAGMILVLTVSLPAALTPDATEAGGSLHFSTKSGAAYAWELTRSGAQWSLSFAPGAVVVDNSSPTDAQLLGDVVQLPAMSITGIADRGGFLMATLTPQQPVTITSDTDNTAVLSAAMQSGGLLAIGTNTVAYSQQADDLSIQLSSANYGVVIPALTADRSRGLLLDLSFSGDAIQGGNVFNVLRGDSGTLRGTLSGQISSVVPEPATLLLLALGAALAGQFRGRRSQLRR